jgi:hypothetical protein
VHFGDDNFDVNKLWPQIEEATNNFFSLRSLSKRYGFGSVDYTKVDLTVANAFDARDS